MIHKIDLEVSNVYSVLVTHDKLLITLHNIDSGLSILSSGITKLQYNMNNLLHYLKTFGSLSVTHRLISPTVIRQMLKKVKLDITSYP